MPKLNYNGNRLPKLCNDRGRAYVWHNKKRVYLGVSGTIEAEENYRQFKINLLQSPTTPDPVQKSESGLLLDVGDDVETDVDSVAGLCVEFLKYHNPRLDKTDVQHFRKAIGFLVGLFGSMSVNTFSPKKMRTVREQMVNSGRYCRNTINRYITKLVRIFAWGCEEEWGNASVAGALRMIKPLPPGEYGTFDHPEREPVPFDVVKRTLPFATPTIATSDCSKLPKLAHHQCEREEKIA